MDKAEQIEIVGKATLLAYFIEEPYRFALYQFGEFYIELLYALKSNVLYGINAFDNPDDLEPYKANLKSFQLNGKPKRTVYELRNQAIKVLQADTLNMIMSTPEEELIFLSYLLGIQLRYELNIWHTIVTEKYGDQLHPDDISYAIL